MRSKIGLLKILLPLLVVLLSLLGYDIYQGPSYSTETQEVKVEEVIDGDSIRVRDLQTDEVFQVRYVGIDAPELVGPAYKTCFGYQAKERNEELVSDQKVLLKFDIDKYDRFGRTLAHVFTLDELGEEEDSVEIRLLEEGYARFYHDKVNTLYQDELVQAALSAREGFLGLWGSCGEAQFGGKCVIKGNVTHTRGEYRKYYHLPGEEYYSRTKVSLLKGDKWLCTIEEAEAENFQHANVENPDQF